MEVAAGVVAAEQVISTTVEGGAVAAYAIAQPTDPLKGTFNRIGSVPSDNESPDSLARSSHIICHIKGDLYIYGGLVGSQLLAGPEMHILKLSNLGGEGPHYRSIPAIAKSESDPVPAARAGHVAVVPDKDHYTEKVIMFGGYEQAGEKIPIDESARVWVFDPETLHWSHLDASGPQFPKARYEHGAVAYKDTLVIHGGYTSGTDSSSPETETWQFDLSAQTWTLLPFITSENTTPASSTVISTTPPILATHSDKLYLLTGSTDALTTTLHILDLSSLNTPGQSTETSDPTSPKSKPSWTSLPVPTNPLTPGPGLRAGATAHAISTGLGRVYLLVLFGSSTFPSVKSSDTITSGDDSETYTSDLWTLQLPTQAATPAAAKDYARSALPNTRTHSLEWHAVTIVPKEEGASATTWLDSARNVARTGAASASNSLASATSKLGIGESTGKSSGATGRARGSSIQKSASDVGSWISSKAAAVANAGRDVSAAAGLGDVEGRAKRVAEEEGLPTASDDAGPGPVLEDREDHEKGKENTLPTPLSPKPETALEPSSSRETRSAPEADAKAEETPLQPPVTANAAAGVVEGKAHPGPRAWCGSAVLSTPWVGVGAGERMPRVVLWGGVNAKREREGDGWVVELKV